MIVNPARFFVVMIIVGMIGMTCEMYNEIQAVPYEQRMQQRMLENKQE
tara:strand:+ start:737 stop:880 length:144 start_codon:yes stop_codon:yes gene_type:complete